MREKSMILWKTFTTLHRTRVARGNLSPKLLCTIIHWLRTMLQFIPRRSLTLHLKAKTTGLFGTNGHNLPHLHSPECPSLMGPPRISITVCHCLAWAPVGCLPLQRAHLPEVMQNLPPSNFNNAALQAQRSNGYGPRGEQRSEQFGWSPVSGAMSPSVDTTSSGYTSPLPGKSSPLPHLSAKASVDSNPPRWASLLHGHEPASNANNPSSITANRLASLSRTATPTPSMDDRRTDSYPQHQPPVSYFFPPSSRQELRDSPNIRVQSPNRIKHIPAIELSEASSTNSASIEST
ncbi:hypothetical protein DFJ73DRAFT_517027 [Zopfochytrium polystomum]|nr:hypothetical protein DFJ73DRAFT_517027 [Zopfochytrium polystomum]